MNIYIWNEYAYYDGLWTFAQICVNVTDERITSWRVKFLNSEASSTERQPE